MIQINYKEFRDRNNFRNKVNFHSNKYDALKNCDALIIVTEWDEFRKADLKKVKEKLKKLIIVDGRNIYEVEKMKKKGFRYISIGR